MILAVIVSAAGVLVGKVRYVQDHPEGTDIWLADVSLGKTADVRIIFGGDHKLAGGEPVPVAIPGSKITVFRRGSRQSYLRNLRSRCYRGEWSHGMLCSLRELGWVYHGPNKVAILRDLRPGQRLDGLPVSRRPEVTEDWDQAKAMEQDALAKGTVLYDLPGLPKDPPDRGAW